MNGKILLLNGGGLDSTAQLILMVDGGKDVTSLHIDYGQDAAEAEANLAHTASILMKQYCYFLKVSRIPEGPIVRGHDLTSSEVKTERAGFEMEGRNMMLLSLALAWANKEYDYLVLANNRAPAYFPDATKDFILHMNRMLVFLGAKPRVIAPFSHMTKLEAVRAAYKINPIVLQAHSCYKAQECGVCPHCIQKAEIVKQCAA